MAFLIVQVSLKKPAKSSINTLDHNKCGGKWRVRLSSLQKYQGGKDLLKLYKQSHNGNFVLNTILFLLLKQEKEFYKPK